MLLAVLVLISSLFEYINMQQAEKLNDVDNSQIFSDGSPKLQQKYSKFSVEIKHKRAIPVFTGKVSSFATTS